MNSRGELTETAGKVLSAMTTAVPVDEVARKSGIALYRVRSVVRELVEAGLAEEKDGIYVAAEAGRSALAKIFGKT